MKLMENGWKKFRRDIPALLEWYRKNARVLPWRGNPTPYRVWVSEIMLQQTRVEAVIRYYNRFMQELPAVAALAEVDDERLIKLWEGLGYYSRARNLKKAAQVIMRGHSGELPNDHKALLALPGIGSYTAGAIASIAFYKPYPAVDGNVLRVLFRYVGSYDDITEPKVKKQTEAILQEMIPAECPGDFAQALMELGALVCVPNGKPDCGACPLGRNCAAKQEGLQDELPVKKAKKKRRIERKTVLVLVHGGKLALQRRNDTGLLAGMWGLPMLDGWQGADEVERFLRQSDFANFLPERLDDAKHIFTHIEWQMWGYFACASEAGGAYEWVSKEELETQYALPSAFRAYVSAYFEHLQQK